MHELPTEWTALCALVFLLGLKHGFDADHLATIDGLTRYNTRIGRRFGRYCGALFSLGHGAIVLAIAAAVGLASERWDAPEWLEVFGAWTSILFLTLIGVVNLHAVLSASPGQVVAPVGLKGRLLGRLNRASHPATVALVGALFALSFDTVSQSALFALTAAQFGGISTRAVTWSPVRARDARDGRHQRLVDLAPHRARGPTRLHCFACDESCGGRRQSSRGGLWCRQACDAGCRCME